MDNAYFLGIDISTTGAKALLMDELGQVIGTAGTSLALSTPQPLWSEQDPADWWQAVGKSIRKVLMENGIAGDAVKAIGMTGQMHGLVMLDDDNRVLRPAMLWNDQRTSEQCDQIRQLVGKERLIRITGNDALTGFTAPKILWVKQHEPQIFGQCRHILLPKDYIRFCLTGEYATDKAGAAGTLLMDIRRRDWSDEVVDILGIPRGWLPPTFEGTQVTGTVTAIAAEQTGLRAGTPVVAGGGDQAAGAVGVGAVEAGIVSLVLGTSGVVFAATDRPFIEENGLVHAFCHALPDTWHLMGVMLSAAGSLQWYHDTIAPESSFDELLLPAANIDAGSDGLFFTPYLTGERTPYPDPYARAGFIGLTRQHTLAHMTRAVLEGVAFGLKDCFELIKAAGLGNIRQVRVSGGGAKSPLWRQILADVLGTELVVVNTSEGAAYGAGLLAAVGMGVWRSVPEACRASIKIVNRTIPDQDQVEIYKKIYPRYRELYPLLKPFYGRFIGN